MRLFKKNNDLQAFIQLQKLKNKAIGFVPTMGALHNGHLTLVEESRKNGNITVVSIFVNPTQFNDKSDLEKYPRTLEKDMLQLIPTGCDVVFAPDVDEIYPNGEHLIHNYDLGTLEKVFDGAYRPGHFQGVCQVVDRLFTIVQPDHVFFGQKDYQQCMVITRLLQLKPQFKNITMHIVPTQRENNGLAMSSRNMRLNESEKETASTIYKTLVHIKSNLKPGDLHGLLKEADNMLRNKGFIPDYVAIANAKTLEPVNYWNGQTPIVALIAAFLGSVRLIDNLILTH